MHTFCRKEPGWDLTILKNPKLVLAIFDPEHLQL